MSSRSKVMGLLIILVFIGTIAISATGERSTVDSDSNTEEQSRPLTDDESEADESESGYTISDWAHDSGPGVDDIVGAFSSMTSAADRVDLDGMSRACADLEVAVRGLMANPPPPDDEVKRIWERGLDSYLDGAISCQFGIALDDLDIMNTVSPSLEVGNNALSSLTTYLEGY